MTNQTPKTMFEKIWEQHVVKHEENSPAVLYIDLHLVHEVTSPQAFQGLREKGLTVRKPSQTVATMDHGIPTTPPNIPITDEMVIHQISQTTEAEDALHFSAVGPNNSFKTKFLTKHSQFLTW